MKKASWFGWYQKGLALVLGGLIFAAPTNFFIKLDTIYVRGLVVDYLLPKLYLVDLLTLALLGWWIFLRLAPSFHKLQQRQSLPNLQKWLRQSQNWSQSQDWLWPITLGVTLILTIGLWQWLVSPWPLSSLWYLGRIGLVLAVGFIIKNQTWVWQSVFVRASLILTLLFQSSLALYQVITQKSLAGYWLLGEPNLVQHQGLATTTDQSLNLFDALSLSTAAGQQWILPYATTAHPNVLAGVLVFYGWLMMSVMRQNADEAQKSKSLISSTQVIKWAVLALTALAILATHSIAGWLAVIVIVFLMVGQRWLGFLQKPITFGLVTVTIAIVIALGISWVAQYYPESPSIARRAYLQEAAWQMWLGKPWTGVGFNTFAAQVENYTDVKEVTRFAQPVHHVGWLYFAEGGLLGMVLLSTGLLWVSMKAQSSTKVPLILYAFLPLAFLDHYLISLPAGLFVLMLVVARVASLDHHHHRHHRHHRRRYRADQ